MPINYINVDSFQTKVNQSYVNLTKSNPTLYPATTSIRFEWRDSDTTTPSVTSVFIFDQYAVRTATSPISG